MSSNNFAINFLAGKLPYTMELTILGHAIWGAMAVKGGQNKSGELHWFHAFVLSVLTGFSGGLFNFLWMGIPTSMISNDVVLASCILAFVTVNYIPFAHKLMNSLPGQIAITIYATLFRSLGLCSFTTTAFNAFKDAPSKYYRIPVFGPIWYGIMLGNMGGFALKGVDGYLKAGVPWPFQNGIFCAPFFHFFCHDEEGPIGTSLRYAVLPLRSMLPDIEDRTFAMAFVGLFMQVVSILQLPAFLGPSFSPFVFIHMLMNAPLETAAPKIDSSFDINRTKSSKQEVPESSEQTQQQHLKLGKRNKNKRSPNKRKKA